MNRFRRLGITAAVVAVLATSALGGLASGAMASTVSLNITCSSKISGTTSTNGTCTGTLGKGTFTSTAAPPNYTQTEKYAGGTITTSGKFTVAEGKLTGTWKVKKATGKFKGATGSGTISIVTVNGVGKATIKGKLSY